MRVVITGANRGIGLELTRQYAARGDRVEATARDPDGARELAALAASSNGRVHVHACDVGDVDSVRGLARAIERDGASDAVDLLINNAGVMGQMAALDGLDYGDLAQTIDTNAIGPLRVTAALLPMLRRGATRKVVHVTSGMGSIGDNTSGGAYGYRMSKAALNMAGRSMAIDLGREGFTVIVVNPGWVKTDMGGHQAPTPVEESAEKLIALFDRIGPSDAGKFFDYRGHTWPW